ncbi:queuosine precursor transporter [Xinfangfangia sp. CPCC 101601]|uniref:Probable queuosine precursor transporter n=1 Tax=Pseudogemmobacter lacusdianii TaxID=3069608 RepID=A0ABU0VXL8_9RHOB|nr:queuosine precursor transporter [Xinfangfangia sp. CPCC 101601]MDQ2066504.1 queuosine precursor transporter [Xinfangfangia sp. CPCC 101601]
MTRLLPGILAMAIVVVASNILVQHPLGFYLTWGALTYPLAFLVNDITNRLHGPEAARRVVFVGFLTGLVCSAIGTQIMGEFGPLVTLRVAIGSGVAFLTAQLMDIVIFNRLRQRSWWKAPLIASALGSVIDTAIFFPIAFSATLSMLEPSNDVSWAGELMPLIGLGPVVPFWVSLATADFLVKLAIAVLALAPFRIAIGKLITKVA